MVDLRGGEFDLKITGRVVKVHHGYNPICNYKHSFSLLQNNVFFLKYVIVNCFLYI